MHSLTYHGYRSISIWNKQIGTLVFWQNSPEDTAFSCKYTRKMSTRYREFIGKDKKKIIRLLKAD